jgi:hypothetical protein
VEHGDAVRVVPEDDAIARAIASVPGVAEADIVRPPGGGRSRLTLRLHPGEDDQRVAWAVAATLRERFDIDLDPDAIRPRMTEPSGPEHDPVAVVRTDDEGAPNAPAPTGSEPDGRDEPDAADAVGASDEFGRDGSEVPSGRTGRVPWPPRDRPWSAREPLDPAVEATEPAASATAPPGMSAPVGRAPDDDAPSAAPTRTDPVGGGPQVPSPQRRIELNTTRERLSRAVEDALAGLAVEAADAPEPAAMAPEPAEAAPGPAMAPEPAATAPGPATAPESATAPGSAATATASAPKPPDVPVASTVPPAAAMVRPPRAVIEHLEVRRSIETVEVAVTLRHETHLATGTAQAAPTSKGRMRATAEATVAAMHALVRTALVVGVDRIVLTDAGDDVTVSVVLTMVTAGDEQRLLGGAIVRDDTDAEGAVVRATLDALNRRVIPLLAAR